MNMPESHGYKFIVVAHDSLTHVCEAQPLHKNNVQLLSEFFFNSLICWYGVP